MLNSSLNHIINKGTMSLLKNQQLMFCRGRRCISYFARSNFCDNFAKTRISFVMNTRNELPQKFIQNHQYHTTKHHNNGYSQNNQQQRPHQEPQQQQQQQEQEQEQQQSTGRNNQKSYIFYGLFNPWFILIGIVSLGAVEFVRRQLFPPEDSYEKYQEKKRTSNKLSRGGYLNPELLTITDYVYFDIVHGEESLGRVIIGLYGENCPKTVRNFLELSSRHDDCSKVRICDLNPRDASPLFDLVGYKGSIFHRVIPNFMIQGGDISHFNGMGGFSIYGSTFEDENFDIPHFIGCVSMANRGKNTNGSQFFITTATTSWLNGRHVVFGRVVSGMDIVKKIEKVPRDKRTDKPIVDVRIASCGVVTPGTENVVEEGEAVNKNRKRDVTGGIIPHIPQPKVIVTNAQRM